MRLGAESMLVLLALALYLSDSALLLARHEAVLIRARRERWIAQFGAHRWRLAGKEPLLPNPLAPHRPIFRLAWQFDRAASATRAPLVAPPALGHFSAAVWISAICLFVLLPAALFVPLGTAFTLAVVALLYLNIVVALVMLYRRRAVFALSGRQFAMLAFECLVCAPLSINLVRKLCARLAPAEDFSAAAARLLAPDERAAALAACRLRLEEEIEFEPEGTRRMQALIAARARFPRVEE